jgi:hypothetical protein
VIFMLVSPFGSGTVPNAASHLPTPHCVSSDSS